MRAHHTPLSFRLLQGYPRGSKELLGPLSAKFGPWETFEWFSSRGVDLKTEKDGRVFPTTDRSVLNSLLIFLDWQLLCFTLIGFRPSFYTPIVRSSSITEILEAAARQFSVDVKCGARVTSIKSAPVILPEVPVLVPISLPSIPLPEIANSDIVVKSSKSKSKVAAKAAPSGPTQFVVTYVSSTAAVFDTMKNSRIEDKSKKVTVTETADEEAEVGTWVKEERSIVCDKVIFATGGSRYTTVT